MFATKSLAICTVLTLLSASILVADDDPRRTIQVTGAGKSASAPDIAMVSTGVVTQGESATDAMTENNKVVANLMKVLEKLNVEKKDIQTSQFAVQPEYERGPRGERKPVIRGYRVTNQVRVRFRDLKNIGTLLDRLIEAGSNQLSGISFGVEDETKAMNVARIEAMKDAKMRAELYAASAGLSVGKVISISEQQTAYPRRNFSGVAMESRGSSVPIATGEQEFSATISVIFELVAEK